MFQMRSPDGATTVGSIQSLNCIRNGYFVGGYSHSKTCCGIPQPCSPGESNQEQRMFVTSTPLSSRSKGAEVGGNHWTSGFNHLKT